MRTRLNPGPSTPALLRARIVPWAAHAQIPDVVEKDHTSRGKTGIDRITTTMPPTTALRTARLIHNSRTG